MDDATKLKVASLSNRISGLKTRLKRDPENTELLARIDVLVTERDELRGPKKESARTTAAPPKRDLDEELSARRSLTSAITRQSGEDPPEIAKLIKHAERHGTAEILQTAVDLGYGYDACVRLQDALDRIDAANHRKEHPHAPAMRFGDSADRVRALFPKEAEADG